jgi:carboxyl-terminal processing protease
MKKQLFSTIIPIFLLIGFVSFSIINAENTSPSKEKLLREIIFQSLINQAHYNVLPLNDEFSGKAYDLYIKRFDSGKRFFIQEDLDRLGVHRLMIDDELKGQANPLFDLAQEIWNVRIKEAKGYCEEILSKPFDFSVDEKIELDSDKRKFASTKEQLREEWRKYLKYQALVRYHTKISAQEKQRENAAKNGSEFKEKTIMEMEEEVRKEVLKNFHNLFDRLEKTSREEQLADYFNAILNVYCPHTEFYPPYDKENFDIQMSGRLEGIGASLSQIDGEIKVMSIVPGSASWKQGELKEEDVILKVAQGEAEPVSVVNMPLKDAIALIRGKRGTEVRLTVRKPNGRLVVIPIVRDVVIIEESYAKAAIIHDETTRHKTGYILLPSFYADFSGKGGRSSAEDVKSLVLQLKAQNVQSIILDLRSNGGGSLQDAIDMSGLFIKDGPIVQVRSRKGEPVVLEDKNPDIAWDGPLAIMINEYSASASEILAAAMQDYGRAIIVGSKTSFGKGTVQRFFDLDYYTPNSMAHLRPMGSVKMTIQKFYRITGKSTQWKGVSADIILPDIYENLEIGESSMDYALPWDEIKPKTFKAWQSNMDLEALAKSSTKRVKNDEVFSNIRDNAARVKKQRETTLQTLEFSRFKAQQEQLDKESEKFKKAYKSYDHLVISQLKEPAATPELESIKSESTQKWHSEIRENPYIYETMAILNDFIKQNSVAVTNGGKSRE